MRLVITLIVLVFNSGCTWLASPVGPSATVPSPVPAPTPVVDCAVVQLVDMGARDSGVFVFRNSADLASWEATVGCGLSFPAAWAAVDFGKQMIVHYASLRCSPIGACSTKIDSVCSYPDRVEIKLSTGCGDALSMQPGLDYRSDSVAVAKSALPVHVTICKKQGPPPPGAWLPTCTTSILP